MKQRNYKKKAKSNIKIYLIFFLFFPSIHEALELFCFAIFMFSRSFLLSFIARKVKKLLIFGIIRDSFNNFCFI
jgi:hypothetical protein